MNSHKYISQALSHKKHGISKDHELIEFIKAVELHYNTTILDVIKTERPIHQDILIEIITDKHTDSQPFRTDTNSHNVLKETYQKCYNQICTTDFFSLEDIVLDKLQTELNDFISKRFLPVWNLQLMNTTFLFFLWNQYDADRMKGFTNQIENEVNNYFWSLENHGFMNKFRIKVNFDSKENLDKNFNGNFRAYFD